MGFTVKKKKNIIIMIKTYDDLKDVLCVVVICKQMCLMLTADTGTGGLVMHVGCDSFLLSLTARANSFVGTAQYVSPELLTEKSACKRYSA